MQGEIKEGYVWAFKVAFEATFSRSGRIPTNKLIGSPNSSSLKEVSGRLSTTSYNAIPIALDLNPNKTNMAH